MQLIKHDQTHDDKGFLRGWYISDTTMCDDIINYFENSNDKRNGMINRGIDPTVKTSTDVIFDISPELTGYFDLLRLVTTDYISLYPMVNYYSPWNVNEYINIQRYNPTEAYYGWHTERVSGNNTNATRHMVLMTYLNDVTDGGETEFYHQNLKIKPEKGLTLIWPADWTYTHRGCPSVTQTKYIVTGWFNYIE